MSRGRKGWCLRSTGGRNPRLWGDGQPPPTVRTPVRVALAGRTGPLTLGLEAPALEAAQDPRNLRVPPLQTSAPAAFGPEASRRSPAEFPPSSPNSQPVSFLISSSSSSRSNVEARDPITEPEAPPGAGRQKRRRRQEGGKGGRTRGQEGRGQRYHCGPGKEPRARARRRAARQAANQKRGCARRSSRRRRSQPQP